MVNCDWQVVTLQMKAEWRSVLTMYGVLCVLIPGGTLMLLWYVGSWATLHKVSIMVSVYGHALFQYHTSNISTDAVAFNNANFGTGVDPIYLDNVDCNGSEHNLLDDCSRSSFVNCYYSHRGRGGAAVRCQG